MGMHASTHDDTSRDDYISGNQSTISTSSFLPFRVVRSKKRLQAFEEKKPTYRKIKIYSQPWVSKFTNFRQNKSPVTRFYISSSKQKPQHPDL